MPKTPRRLLDDGSRAVCDEKVQLPAVELRAQTDTFVNEREPEYVHYLC